MTRTKCINEKRTTKSWAKFSGIFIPVNNDHWHAYFIHLFLRRLRSLYKKVYSEFSAQYFSAFGLNTEIYSVKYGPEKVRIRAHFT